MILTNVFVLCHGKLLLNIGGSMFVVFKAGLSVVAYTVDIYFDYLQKNKSVKFGFLGFFSGTAVGLTFRITVAIGVLCIDNNVYATLYKDSGRT
jgi:hypothetical protein